MTKSLPRDETIKSPEGSLRCPGWVRDTEVGDSRRARPIDWNPYVGVLQAATDEGAFFQGHGRSLTVAARIRASHSSTSTSRVNGRGRAGLSGTATGGARRGSCVREGQRP